MKAEEGVRLKKLEDEDRRLKQLLADLSLDNPMLIQDKLKGGIEFSLQNDNGLQNV